MSSLDSVSLSFEQEAAVTSQQPSLVVTAAAGSGKTRVLVERYLRHITQDGCRADGILTITFTRKAAAEMKRRIVDRLTQLGLAEQAQIAETGPIQTIHGFCERLLRENSLEAGLDPEFEILSEAQANRLREAAVQDVLAGLTEEDEEQLKLVTRLAGKRSFGERSSPHGRLEQSIRKALGELRGLGISVDDLEASHRNPIALMSEWRSKLLQKGVMPEVQSVVASDTSGDSFATKITSAYKQLGKPKPRFVRPTVSEDLASAEDTCGLIQIVCAAWRRLEREMRRLQAVDFTLLEADAVNLISRSEVVRQRLQQQYPVVLIDEAQDLNPMQYKLLKELKPRTEMLVGDHQQSIYGFRQADVGLFIEKSCFTPSTKLTKNYRSKDGVLSFVDLLFSSVWEKQYQPLLPYLAPMDGIEFWIQKQKDTDCTATWIGELVEERRAIGKSAKDIAVLVRNSRYGLDLVERLSRAGVPARMAGGTEQFYARLEVRDLANALEAICNPFDSFALAALLRSPFVGLSLDSIVLLAKTSPLFKNLEGFEPPVPDDALLLEQFKSWFLPLSQYGDRLAAWEAIGELFAKSPYLENIARRKNGVQMIANVRKLLTLATQEPELSPIEYASRIREIQEIRHKEGDAPASDDDADEVTIMTIHKSKGLEFPVVVLPDTHQRLTKPMQDVEIDPGLAMITTRFDKAPSMFHEWLAANRQAREMEEEWRVMYVAMTRAEEKICICLNPSGGGDKFAEKIPKLIRFKDTPPEGVLVRSLSQHER